MFWGLKVFGSDCGWNWWGVSLFDVGGVGLLIGSFEGCRIEEVIVYGEKMFVNVVCDFVEVVCVKLI